VTFSCSRGVRDNRLLLARRQESAQF